MNLLEVLTEENISVLEKINFIKKFDHEKFS